MTITNGGVTACPACGEDNIRGADRCGNCLLSLSRLDTPLTDHALGDSALAEELSTLRIHPANTLDSTVTVKEAIAALRENPTGALLLEEYATKRIVGIFTEHDVMTKLAGYDVDFSQPVSSYMTEDPVILRDSDTIAVALNKMGDGGFRHIPLFHDGALAGVVTASDLARWVMTNYLA